MSEFTMIRPNEWTANAFSAIGEDWMLVTAEAEGRANAMTASWGGVGVLWGKNVAYVSVRKSRFTKTLIDQADTLSLAFFDHEANAEMLTYMGRNSGRDEDKLARANLTVRHSDGIAYLAEAETVLLCRKLACVPITPEHMLDPSLDDRFYRDGDYHDMYVVEITGVLTK